MPRPIDQDRNRLDSVDPTIATFNALAGSVGGLMLSELIEPGSIAKRPQEMTDLTTTLVLAGAFGSVALGLIARRFFRRS